MGTIKTVLLLTDIIVWYLRERVAVAELGEDGGEGVKLPHSYSEGLGEKMIISLQSSRSPFPLFPLFPLKSAFDQIGKKRCDL